MRAQQLTLFVPTIVVLITLLMGCSQSRAPETDQILTSEELSMEHSNKEAALPSVPPIDASAPNEFEVAALRRKRKLMQPPAQQMSS